MRTAVGVLSREVIQNARREAKSRLSRGERTRLRLDLYAIGQDRGDKPLPQVTKQVLAVRSE
jgi:hypothetical protein